MSWARNYDACIDCGTTEKKHNGRGRCPACYNRWYKTDAYEKVTFNVQLRRRDGVMEYRCPRCRVWRTRDHYRGKKHRSQPLVPTPCIQCRREIYRENKEKWNVKRREWQQQRLLLDQEGRRLDKVESKSDRWARNGRRDKVRSEMLVPVIEAIVRTLPDGENTLAHVAFAVGVDESLIRRVVAGQRSSVTLDTAELLCIRAGVSINELVGEPGKEGWGPRDERFCQRCGTSNRPHHGRGMCRRCYHSVYQFERRGAEVLPPPWERWSLNHPWCRCCRSAKHKHRQRGLCTACFSRLQREARKAGMLASAYMDQQGYPRSQTYQRPPSRKGSSWKRSAK